MLLNLFTYYILWFNLSYIFTYLIDIYIANPVRQNSAISYTSNNRDGSGERAGDSYANMMKQNERDFDKEQQKFLSDQYQQQLRDKQLKGQFELDSKRQEQERIQNEANYAKSVSFC